MRFNNVIMYFSIRPACQKQGSGIRAFVFVIICLSVKFSIDSSAEQPQKLKTHVDTTTQAMNVQGSIAKIKKNPWGEFLPGTWVIRRTNSLHSATNFATGNVTDTLLTLEAVDESGIRLRQETVIGIADSAFTPDPKQIHLDYFMQPVAECIKVEQLPSKTVVVSRRQIVCQVLRYTQIHSDQKKTTTLWHSDTVMPYLLRSEEIRTILSLSTDQPETVISHTIMTVTDTSGVKLFKNLLSDYQTQMIKKTASGTVVSQASHSMNIPGGLLREVAVETDTANKVVGRSVTSVVDYFVACPGVPVRQRRFNSEASQEIKKNWGNIPIQNLTELPE